MTELDFAISNADGEIIHVGRSAAALRQPVPPGGRMVIGQQVDPDTQYIDPVTGEVTLKPEIASTISKTTVTADGVDVMTISGLPVPTRFRITGPVGMEGSVSDGVLELTFDHPGTYRILLQALNRMPRVYEVTAV